MRSCINWTKNLRLRLLALGLCFACSLNTPALADGIDIRKPQLYATEDGGYAVSAEFRIDFTSRLEEAVTKGVILHFVLDFVLEQPRWYWLNEKIVSRSQTWRLSYHALTRQYRLSTGSLHLSFTSLEEALQMLSRVRRWLVVDATLPPGDNYQAALRLHLDISQLPRPFQVSALASREWNLDSDWLRWPVVLPAAATEAPGTPGPAAEDKAPPAQDAK